MRETTEFEHYVDEVEGIENESSQMGKGLGIIGAAYGGIPVAKWAARRTPFVQKAIASRASTANNILKGYYAAGVSSLDKLMLQKDHFFGSNRSELRDTAKFLKQAHADATQELLLHGKGRPLKGTVRHMAGMALRELDMINEILPAGEKIDPRNLVKNGQVSEKDVNKILNLIKSGKIPYGSPGELLQTIKLDYMYERQNLQPDKVVGGIGAQKRQTRHEIVKTELNKAVTDQPFDQKKLKAAGYSVPEKQITKNVFKGPHAGVAAKWQLLPQDRITISSFTDSAIGSMGGVDKAPISLANKKDSMFKLAEYVTKNAKDLNNPKEVFEWAKHRAASFGTSRHLLDASSRIHPQDDYIRAVERFMKSYYVKNGRLHINFSPDFKPSYLLGGVNTDGIFWKKKNGQVGWSMLTTDKYDLKGPEEVVGEGGVQRRRHITIHSHASSKADNLFKKPNAYVANSQILKDAIKNKDMTQAFQAMKRLGKNTSKRIIAEFGSKHWANRHLLKLVKMIVTRRA